MKKVVRLTEDDLNRIVKRVIKEQTEDRDFIRAVQDFLNARYRKDPKFTLLVVDGRTGPNSKTEEAIKRYQSEKGIEVDGTMGNETSGAMRKDGLGKFEKKYKFLGIF